MPIVLLDADTGQPAVLKRALARDEPVTFADLALPESRLLSLFHEQAELLRQG